VANVHVTEGAKLYLHGKPAQSQPDSLTEGSTLHELTAKERG
jgi:hypothetical protein